MKPFFRFPATPHLAWLGSEAPRSDKIVTTSTASKLLDGDLFVEEKVDGANLGLWVDGQGAVHAQNRGSILQPGGHPQWGPLWPWLDLRRAQLAGGLASDLILFGEWCFARHSILYCELFDWFVVFDVWDRSVARWWSTSRRDALVTELGLCSVPRIAHGRFDLPSLVELAEQTRSRLGADAVEGVVVRLDSGPHLDCKAKLVCREFTSGIETHWSRRPLQTNRLRSTTSDAG